MSTRRTAHIFTQVGLVASSWEIHSYNGGDAILQMISHDTIACFWFVSKIIKSLVMSYWRQGRAFRFRLISFLLNLSIHSRYL